MIVKYMDVGASLTNAFWNYCESRLNVDNVKDLNHLKSLIDPHLKDEFDAYFTFDKFKCQDGAFEAYHKYLTFASEEGEMQFVLTWL